MGFFHVEPKGARRVDLNRKLHKADFRDIKHSELPEVEIDGQKLKGLELKKYLAKIFEGGKSVRYGEKILREALGPRQYEKRKKIVEVIGGQDRKIKIRKQLADQTDFSNRAKTHTRADFAIQAAQAITEAREAKKYDDKTMGRIKARRAHMAEKSATPANSLGALNQEDVFPGKRAARTPVSGHSVTASVNKNLPSVSGASTNRPINLAT